MVSVGPDKGYLYKLLDSTDRTADCMALGILLGFLCFTSLILVFGLVYFGHAVFPKYVILEDVGSFAAAVVALGGAYSAVLGATTAAYRWRNDSSILPQQQERREDRAEHPDEHREEHHDERPH